MPARILLSYFVLGISSMVFAANPQKTNVLFIIVDDLRPALGCYGDKLAFTPNIDALAQKGVLFKKAYCQQAVCSPSRTSILTGLRPDQSRVWELKTLFRETIPSAVTLPQHFKKQRLHHRPDRQNISRPGFPPGQCVVVGTCAVQRDEELERKQICAGRKPAKSWQGRVYRKAACGGQCLHRWQSCRCFHQSVTSNR